MRRVIKDTHPEDLISIRRVKVSKVYAYKTDHNTLCVLTTLGTNMIDQKYGFVRIGDTRTKPVFQAKFMEKSIDKAMNKGRNVMEFDGAKEMFRWHMNIKQPNT